MSLSNSVGVARASTHALGLAAPAVTLSRVTATAITPAASHPTPFSRAVAKLPAAASVVPLHSIPATPQAALSPLWFNSTFPADNQGSRQPDNERKVKLGKTLRILQERLPTLLQSPLPSEILSPNISLHLFPSTHPHLPTVSGKVAYIAALWTSPIAWNRVPIVGNVRLEILSERMISQPLHFSPRRPGAYGEQLIVKWRTASPSSESGSGGSSSSSKLSLTERGETNLDAHLRGSQAVDDDNKKAFTGLFVFEFDKDGRVVSHTIEHVDEHGEWGKGVGARVVGLTDWLLGGIKSRTGTGGGLPALCEAVDDRGSKKGLR